MGDPMSYDAETEAELRKWEEKIDETTQKCTGKMSHKIAEVPSLKPFNECVPGVAGTYKQKQKIYMANWADHKETDDKAPFCCSLQAGFVAVVDAKSMKVMKKLVKEGFVLEAAVSPYSTNCQYVVTGGMQNVINVYDTAQGGGIPGTAHNKQEYALKETKSFTDDDPKCDFASHAGYISGLEFIEGGSKLVSYADTRPREREPRPLF